MAHRPGCSALKVWAGDAVPLRAGRAGMEGSAEAVGLGGLCDPSTLTQGTSVYCSVLHTCPWHDISTNGDHWETKLRSLQAAVLLTKTSTGRNKNSVQDSSALYT